MVNMLVGEKIYRVAVDIENSIYHLVIFTGIKSGIKFVTILNATHLQVDFSMGNTLSQWRSTSFSKPTI